MSRAKGMDGQASRLRADLEGAILSIVDCEEVLPEITLRIEQAVRRSGLASLLDPALEDLARMAASMREAKALVRAAALKLVE